MQLPSLNHLLGRAAGTFRRFPATLLDSILGTVCIVIELGTGPESSRILSVYEKLAITTLLGLPLFLAIELFLERRGERLASGDQTPSHRPGMRWILYLAAIFALGIFYTTIEEGTGQAIRTVLLALAAHLAVSFVAYLKRDETNGFWQLNKLLFLRILVSELFTAVLMAGLSLAIAAVDQLFNANIPERTYGQLAAILFGVFNTWFFLAGIPYALRDQQYRTDYPKGLKVFTQFVLLPLVTIYLVLLYAYALKLLVDWELPNGWVSNPVLWFSVVGILSFLLLYPLKDDEGNEWIRSFSRYFYIALLPLLTLPILGIYTRTAEYGLTVERYLVIALVIWLLGISTYFIISRRKDIRTIPISLAIGALIAAIGPASAFSLSKRDQLGRLERLVRKHNLVTPTRDFKKPIPVPYKDFDRIYNISRYLSEMHGYDEIAEWVTGDLQANIDPERTNNRQDIGSLFNMSTEFPSTSVDTVSAPMRIASNSLVPISGYDLHGRIALTTFHPSDYGYGHAGPDPTILTTPDGLSLINDYRNGHITITQASDSIRITYLEIAQEVKLKQDSINHDARVQSKMNAQPAILRESSAFRVLIWAGDIRLPDRFSATTSTVDFGFNGDVSVFIKRKKTNSIQ